MIHRNKVAACSVFGLLACAGTSFGQFQPCGAAAGITGPDVVVGFMGAGGGNGTTNEIVNYTAQSLGGVLHDGCGSATYSCNIGTANLAWFDGTVNIPVISQALYRYTKGANNVERFEMLSYAWLKYAFTALQHSVCCASCSPTGGTTLGVGCSDPYTSSRNAFQNTLGPKWQINAATGAHPVDPVNPAWSGAAARRIQVPVNELPPSNGTTIRYFVEGQYVTPDDAAAGNKHNNASYREVNVTGAGDVNKTFAWTVQCPSQSSPCAGATTRMSPAVNQWKVINPNVTMSTFIVPGDGKFFVLSNATDLGNGTWDYEYVVHNLNSDRNAGSFSVPMLDAVAESGVAFHDIAYHDGDGPASVNFSGTDWPSTKTGGFLTWATQTQAQNASANAIRWASAYNFRFVCNQPPVAGNVTVGLWKPGTPTEFSVAAVVPATPVICACDHDHSGTLDSFDFFAYLDDFFILDRDADFDESGTVDSTDFFAWLDCFLTGCD